MAYQIKLYDYSLDGNDYCIGSDRLNLLELTWQLECAQGQDVDVHISSVGGSAFEAIGMYDALKKYPGKVTTYVDSLAASAASIIAMAGSLVVMSKYALLMIHKPMVGSGGNADELIADAAMLNVVQSRLAGIYLDKTGLDIDTINELINATTWLTAEQALDLGFIDQIEDYSGAEVTNIASILSHANVNAPAIYKRVLNKLNTKPQNDMNTDKDLIEKTQSVLNKIMNFFKRVEVKTVTNSGTIKSMGPLNVGAQVTNEDDTDTEDGEYEVDNNGVKCKVTVKDSIVTNMEDEKTVENEAATDDEVKDNLVLNSVGLKVTNKADASGIAKVVTNYQATVNEQNVIIVELNKQLKVSNEAVSRDEAAIRATIESEYTPEGSKRANVSAKVGKTTNQVTENLKPKSAIAQRVYNQALATQGK